MEVLRSMAAGRTNTEVPVLTFVGYGIERPQHLIALVLLERGGCRPQPPVAQRHDDPRTRISEESGVYAGSDTTVSPCRVVPAEVGSRSGALLRTLVTGALDLEVRHDHAHR